MKIQIRKSIYAALLLTALLVLTGCGAKISTQLYLDEDFMGGAGNNLYRRKK